MAEASGSLRTVPLDALHRSLGARMVPYAGYAMPVQYEGIVAEHQACRAGAALFDVSHMGQAGLSGAGAVAALERLVPGDVAALKQGRQRYTMLTNDAGGIRDDLMVANLGDRLFLVVNAACKEDDFAYIGAHLPPGVKLERHEDRGLLALQGPKAATMLGRLAPDAETMPFLGFRELVIVGIPCLVSRSGYTGEDGYEISVPAAKAERLARTLLDDGAVPAGLGARDSLRLDAGLCLYGNDIDTTTTPVEAGLMWTISKRRRVAGDFPGAGVIREQLEKGPERVRVGLRPEGRAPARAGTEIAGPDGAIIGKVTSGGFSPTVGAPVAMGYVAPAAAADGAALSLIVRGRPLPAQVVPMPFVPHRYVR